MTSEQVPSGEAPSPPGPRPAFTRVSLFTMRGLRLLGRGVRLILQAVVAIVIIFEEWGWRPLAAALAGLARLAPVAWLEGHIRHLPPYGALLVFAVPSALLFPLKLLALYLITAGYKLAAGALFAGAKVAGTAVVARLFQLTEPQLMRIPWFAWGYGIFRPWKDALIAWARASWVWRWGRVVKERVKRFAKPWFASVRAQAVQFVGWIRSRLGRS